MTAEERIRAGGVVLVFDAPNVPATKLFALARAAKENGRGLRLVVPMTAHVEKLVHLRRAKGRAYSAETVTKALEEAGVEVPALDLPAADGMGERLCAWFPTSQEWQDAKWRRLHGERPRGKDKHPPATVDWFTAAFCPPGGIVVTNDERGEFSACETIKPEALERVLREMAGDALR